MNKNNKKQTYEHNDFFDVLVTAKQTQNGEVQKRGFFPANCEDEQMIGMVLNKYWHENGDDQYKVVAYLSEDFFDRYDIADMESIYDKTKVVSIDNAKENDPVNRPKHYLHKEGGIECIDYIKQQLGTKGFEAYMEGQILRYMHRNRLKDENIQDLEKAEWYLKKLIAYRKNL